MKRQEMISFLPKSVVGVVSYDISVSTLCTNMRGTAACSSKRLLLPPLVIIPHASHSLSRISKYSYLCYGKLKLIPHPKYTHAHTHMVIVHARGGGTGLYDTLLI